jgi:hypothetical protein
MKDARKPAGVVAGTALSAIAVLAAPHRAATGPLTPDAGGAIGEVVVHFTRDAGPTVGTAYRDLLSQLPADVTVDVVCPEDEDFRAFTDRVGGVACRVRPVAVRHPVTAWSRDRWVALSPAHDGEPVRLLLPREEEGAATWPARAGDERVGEDLANAFPDGVRALRSHLFFDGGDFVADERTVLVAEAVLRRNLQRTVGTREELEGVLASRFRRRVVLLHDVPDHHAGMYVMLAGGGVAVVGDPSLALRTLGGVPREPLCPCGDDFSPATQRLFDSCAEQCAAAGFRVVRIPTVAGRDSRTFVTFVNALLDERDGLRTVYMPSYANAPALTDAAERVWRGLGFAVRRVDCTRVYPEFGTIHCLANVLRRRA